MCLKSVELQTVLRMTDLLMSIKCLLLHSSAKPRALKSFTLNFVICLQLWQIILSINHLILNLQSKCIHMNIQEILTPLFVTVMKSAQSALFTLLYLKRLIKKLRLYLLKLMLNHLLKLQMQVSVMKNRQNILLWKLTFHL